MPKTKKTAKATAPKLPTYWLTSFPQFDELRRTDHKRCEGVELMAVLRGGDGTAGVVSFLLDGSIELWRNGNPIHCCRSLKALYAFATRKNIGGTLLPAKMFKPAK